MTAYPAGSLLTLTRNLLRRYGLKARKGLGQHFLVDEKVLETIVATAELSPDEIVFEIGPGLGVLTRELVVRAGWVVAIELDTSLAENLKQSLASFKNITVINRNILEVDPETLLGELKAELSPSIKDPARYKVVANLPYYIASPVLRHFLEASVKPREMVVMVQKEVAEEIVAKPGDMSLLSIGVQLYGEPQIISYVPADSFYPPPKVDSAILKIRVYSGLPVVIGDTTNFFALVRAGFSASRKQLVNSLAQGLSQPKTEILALLETAGISSQRRAETLTLEEWARLWRVFTRGEKTA